jgi:Domain of unknown function (DUF4349)
MRLSEDLPLDPDVLAELEAIDATLRGEAVDPIHAELAELALLLAAERPPMPQDAAQALDEQVARRFAPASAGANPTSQHPRQPRWVLRPAFGQALAGLAALAVVAVVVTQVNTGGSSSTASSSSSAAASSNSSPQRLSPASPHGHSAASTPLRNSLNAAGALSAKKSAANSPSRNLSLAPPSPAESVPNGAFAPAVPTPQANGQKQIQSAQLQLLAAGNRIDAVSQEVFTVVGNQSGIVKSSTITAASGNSGYASFQLSIPSGNLPETMTQLSELRYAHVASRTDQTQNVNDQYQSDVRALNDARALRTSLLKQLADAVTTAQIDSLTAQIHDAEASISSDQATLNGLNHQIDYSQLNVQINAGPIPPVPVANSSGGFTLHRAAHDAVRVLTVATGVALIALAALLPVGLLAALGAWIAYWVRRRRREAALDSM